MKVIPGTIQRQSPPIAFLPRQSMIYFATISCPLGSDRDFYLHTSLDIDDDLLHHLRRRIKTSQNQSATTPHSISTTTSSLIFIARSAHLLDQPLMDPHLVRIPRLTPLTTGRLPGRDLEFLRRQSYGSLDAQIFGLGTMGFHLCSATIYSDERKKGEGKGNFTAR